MQLFHRFLKIGNQLKILKLQNIIDYEFQIYILYKIIHFLKYLFFLKLIIYNFFIFDYSFINEFYK